MRSSADRRLLDVSAGSLCGRHLGRCCFLRLGGDWQLIAIMPPGPTHAHIPPTASFHHSDRFAARNENDISCQVVFYFETSGERITRRTKEFFLQKFSSVSKPTCKRASCNWLCYITRLYINCHGLLNYCFGQLLTQCVICTYFHALHYYYFF